MTFGAKKRFCPAPIKIVKMSPEKEGRPVFKGKDIVFQASFLLVDFFSFISNHFLLKQKDLDFVVSSGKLTHRRLENRKISLSFPEKIPSKWMVDVPASYVFVSQVEIRENFGIAGLWFVFLLICLLSTMVNNNFSPPFGEFVFIFFQPP